jgi:hypothetical protein
VFHLVDTEFFWKVTDRSRLLGSLNGVQKPRRNKLLWCLAGPNLNFYFLGAILEIELP